MGVSRRLGKEEPQPIFESRFVLIGSKVAEPCLQERRKRNEEKWADPGRWYLTFYFGAGDDRLWVPAKLRSGQPHPSKLVLNLRHPRARGAAIALGVAYTTGVLWLVVLVAWLLGTGR